MEDAAEFWTRYLSTPSDDDREQLVENLQASDAPAPDAAKRRRRRRRRKPAGE